MRRNEEKKKKEKKNNGKTNMDQATIDKVFCDSTKETINRFSPAIQVATTRKEYKERKKWNFIGKKKMLIEFTVSATDE